MSQQAVIATNRELRAFGLILGGILLSVFGLMVPLIKHGSWNAGFSGIGLTLCILGVFFPQYLTYPHIWWMRLGMFLGFINTRIILGIVFFLFFAPCGISRRLRKVDTLKLRISKNLSSYRILSQSTNISTLTKPF